MLKPALRAPGEPRVYRRAIANGRRDVVAPSVGMERSTALKAAWWRGSIAPERSLPCHDFVSLFLHLQGAPVRRADGIPERAGPGAAIAPGLLDAATWESEGAFEWCQFYISRRVLDEVANDRFERHLPELLVDPRSVARTPSVARLAWQARNELFREQPSALQLDGWAVLLADAFLRDLTPHPSEADVPAARRRPVRHPAVARAIEFVEATLDRNVSLDEMARAAEVSRFHLVRLFRDGVGQTPAAFARARRIERAKDLLRGSDLPLTQVALACGFADQSHFTTAFTRSTGLSPRAYRGAA